MMTLHLDQSAVQSRAFKVELGLAHVPTGASNEGKRKFHLPINLIHALEVEVLQSRPVNGETSEEIMSLALAAATVTVKIGPQVQIPGDRTVLVELTAPVTVDRALWLQRVRVSRPALMSCKLVSFTAFLVTVALSNQTKKRHLKQFTLLPSMLLAMQKP